MSKIQVVSFLQHLIQHPSSSGAIYALNSALKMLGFKTELLTFSETVNLYAIRDVSTTKEDDSLPTLGFLGHADVVPEGKDWTVPPFEGLLKKDAVWGRGAVDMKGGLACFLTAVSELVEERCPLPHLEVLISGNEEGPAVNGTPAVLQTLKEQGRALSWDFALVGEPTAHKRLGDFIKIGSRGSLNVVATAHGISGHVAYPDCCANPVPVLMEFLTETKKFVNHLAPRAHPEIKFEPTQMQITKIQAGEDASNVVPACAQARFNIRYSPDITAESLISEFQTLSETCLSSQQRGIRLSLNFDKAGTPVLSPRSPAHEILNRSILLATGEPTCESVLGATSDARFFPPHIPFAECGLRVQGAHQANERVLVGDLYGLVKIYKTFISLFASWNKKGKF